MVQDRDFKSMLDEREAGKTRGPPASSHFAKMQNSTVWGVKPNFMGEDKDWVMPKDIPKAKTNDSNNGEVHKSKKDRDSPTNTSNAAARGDQITDCPDTPGHFNSQGATLYVSETGEKLGTRGNSTNEKKKKRAEKLNPSKNPTQKRKKADDIKEPDETPGSKNKAISPLNAEGLVRKSDDSARDKKIDAANNLSEKGFNDAEAANMAGLGASEKYSGVGHLDESASHDKDGKEVGETVTSRKSAFGTEIRPFKDIMVAKAGGAAFVEGEKHPFSRHPELSDYMNPDNPNTDGTPVANNTGVEEEYMSLFEPEVYAEDLIEDNKRAAEGDETSNLLVKLDEKYGNPGPFQSNQWHALQNSVDSDSDEESKRKADKVTARKEKKKSE